MWLLFTLLSLSHIQRERRLLPNSLESENTIKSRLRCLLPPPSRHLFCRNATPKWGKWTPFSEEKHYFCAMGNMIETHERGTGYFHCGIVSSVVRHSHELCHGSRLQDISWWKLQGSLQLLWFHQERKILYLSVSRTDFRHHPGIYSIYNGNERIYVRKFAQE